MSVLKNARHERFAQAIADGKVLTEAYAIAGFAPDSGNASRLVNRPHIQARIQRLTEAAAEKVGITKAKVLSELAKIGFANMDDYIKIDADGLPYVDMSRLTREQAAAIGEVHVETRTERGGENEPDADIKKVRFKLLDKRGALVDIGKELGMFREKVEHSGGVHVSFAADDAKLL